MATENTRNIDVRGEFDQKMVATSMPAIKEAWTDLLHKTGDPKEMVGWLNYPEEYMFSKEFCDMCDAAYRIREQNNAVVFIGIGGSYLTGKMLLSAFYGEDYNSKLKTEIYFSGNELSPEPLLDLHGTLAGKENWSVVYISKSGGTTEPAWSFRTLYSWLVAKYGEAEANKHIYTITDPDSGTLRNMTTQYGWKSFAIPKNIGGRYSGLTPVGLLCAEIAEIGADHLLTGAIHATNDCCENTSAFAFQYAAWRTTLYYMLLDAELLAVNSADMSWLGEWWKQLFGESDGKENGGLFPASIVISRDLHSMGQYAQDGKKDFMFETFLYRTFVADVVLPDIDLNDGLKKYVGKTFTEAANAAMDSAFKAHSEGGNACAKIFMGNTAQDMGAMMQYMFISCALGGLARGINPFDQPGVEQYKKYMKEILSK